MTNVLLAMILAAPSEIVRVDDAAWRILGFYDLGKTAKSNNMFHRAPSTEGRFVMVAYEIESGLQVPDRIYRHPRIVDDRGRSFDPVDGQDFLVPEGKATLGGKQLPPGVPKELWAVYEVSATSQGFRFEARTMTAFGQPKWIALGGPQNWPPPRPKPRRTSRANDKRPCSMLYAAMHPDQCANARSMDRGRNAVEEETSEEERPKSADEETSQEEQQAFVQKWLNMPEKRRATLAPSLSWEKVNALPAEKMIPEEIARWSELNPARWR